jgi:hypothetical protein
MNIKIAFETDTIRKEVKGEAIPVTDCGGP